MMQVCWILTNSAQWKQNETKFTHIDILWEKGVNIYAIDTKLLYQCSQEFESCEAKWLVQGHEMASLIGVVPIQAIQTNRVAVKLKNNDLRDMMNKQTRNVRLDGYYFQ